MKLLTQKLYYSTLLFLFIIFNLHCSKPIQKDYPIEPVPFTDVQFTDNFWLPRMETNRTITIPYAFQKCEETGRVDNFAVAGGLQKGEQKGIYPFDDTDIYKTLEGASYALMIHPDPKLDIYLDSLITLVAAAQEDDGYLYTARTNKSERLKRWYGEKRWQKIQDSHELYNAGHMYEAATAHYLATGKRNLLDIAIKNANLVDQVFGPGKLEAPPGHQVIEMGLIKLYRVTKDERYLNLAKFFLDIRGKSTNGRELGGKYNQDHKLILEQNEAVGHAVRASYMYAGIADVAAITGDKDYIKTIDRLWENVVGKKLYLTGGIGATGSGEAFGKNYELPNMSAYNETCAAIGNVYWNHRLFLLHGDAKYLDIMERTLYNGLISGISLDGKYFFYPNPLESVGQHERSSWFGCACCPGNVTRFIASVPGYMYAHKDDNIFINLYASNEATLRMNKNNVKIIQKTNYPWDGTIKINVYPEKSQDEFCINLRIPGWVQNRPVPSDLYRYINNNTQDITILMNGEQEKIKIKNGFAQIKRSWNASDEIDLFFPMVIRKVVAHDSVEANLGKIALERGPIVYCLEFPDNKDGHVRNLLLKQDAKLTTEFHKELLNGVQIITGQAIGTKYTGDEASLEKWDQNFKAIPYYAWAHRGIGEMTVWMAREESAVNPLAGPTIASLSKITVSDGKNPQAMNDQLYPKSSIDHDVPFFHWWPNKGTTEWVQIDFPKMTEVSTVDVYWFDDRGRGECRIPKFWRLFYQDSNDKNKWNRVYTEGRYGLEKDQYNKVLFETVKTKALKLEIESQPDFAGGIHEIKIK